MFRWGGNEIHTQEIQISIFFPNTDIILMKINKKKILRAKHKKNVHEII